ncbi:hypothetical protein ACIRBX_19190 [Kitasatospora sp. NPDC096147]|uniref:hypothetical protein n=1 Tax=Kitasatospora sp. NPDC096147 TaxID=3364093 RepID=UPI00382143B1
MTAPGGTRPQPGRARAGLDPVAALWALLLGGLLLALPCAGPAHAVARAAAAPVPVNAVTTLTTLAGASTEGPGPRADRHRAPHHQPGRADLPSDRTLCSIDGERQYPGSGCSGHAFCGPEAQLPNAPPQPVPAVPARLVAPQALPAPARPSPPGDLDLAPDLHVLQVQLS